RNALQHVFRTGTPEPELDAVFFFECGSEVCHVFGHKRSVDVDLALFASTLEQTLFPIGSLIVRKARRGFDRLRGNNAIGDRQSQAKLAALEPSDERRHRKPAYSQERDDETDPRDSKAHYAGGAGCVPPAAAHQPR